MIPEELAKKIRYLQIFTTRAANNILAGEYKSTFKGRGIEFDEFREYQPGDDVRAIDWNVTARTGKPFIKRYREERELSVIFVVDLSASVYFGTVRRLKSEAAAEVTALLAFSALQNNDKVGLLAFTDRIEKFIPPAKETRHVLRVIREILNFRPRRAATDIAGALEYLLRVIPRRVLVFLISDFQAEGFEMPFRILACRHDLIPITISDPREFSLPDAGLIELEDPETGGNALVDTAGRAVREKYETKRRNEQLRLKHIFQSAGVDELRLSTERSLVYDLLRFFKYREKKR